MITGLEEGGTGQGRRGSRGPQAHPLRGRGMCATDPARSIDPQQSRTRVHTGRNPSRGKQGR
eukprot:6285085-Alexandrium_andersonii.AAC.1